jgi:hypothetical protein
MSATTELGAVAPGRSRIDLSMSTNPDVVKLIPGKCVNRNGLRRRLMLRSTGVTALGAVHLPSAASLCQIHSPIKNKSSE